MLEAIASQGFAYVLAPHGSGKSSLMGRAIRRLRADGQLAAVVDLNQIAARGEKVDSARWHYSVAYRICRELRLRVDLQAWWQDRSLLVNEQRLAEFFWDVVLANTSESVTVFFDEAERAVSLPFAEELFAAIHSCYMRRVSEPEFSRLNFVVIGAATAAQLCPDPGISPFPLGRAIELNDFTVEECLALAPGLEGMEAEEPLRQIHRWTRGQPYLTQKLARGIARRGKYAANIEALANELFLAAGVAREEPLLAQVHASLRGDSTRHRQAGAILRRLGRGQEVIDDPRSVPQSILRLAGITASDDNGMLHFRNRIVERVFGHDQQPAIRAEPWVRSAVIGACALLVFAVSLVGYFQVLPAADIAILETDSDFELVSEAHAALGRLPGHRGTADELFAAALQRLGLAAESVDELSRITTALRRLPDGSESADRLSADFWLRRSAAAAARGERDIALMHALAARRGGLPAATALAGNLISGDYRKLDRSLALDLPPLALAANWERGQLVIVDTGRRVHRLPLRPGAQAVDPAPDPDLKLTALQHVGVTVDSFVDEPGSAGSLELWLDIEHPRSSDLLLRLTAPSGAQIEFNLPDRDTESGRFRFSGVAAGALSALAAESITGRWELTLFDRVSELSGRLYGWGLRFAGVDRDWDEAIEQGLLLPDPERVDEARVELSRNGRYAAVLPLREDARGAISVWDLENGQWLTDLPLNEPVSFVEWLNADRMLVVASRKATLWDVPGTSVVRSLESVGGFELEPAISPEGEHFALAEEINAGLRVSLFDARTGSRRGLYESDHWNDWVLGPEARFAVKLDGSRRGRVVDPRSGAAVTDFFHERPLMGLLHSDSPDRVIAIDDAGEVFTWSIADGRPMLSPLESRYLGSTGSIAGVSLAADGSSFAVPEADNLVTVVDPERGQSIAQLAHAGTGSIRTLLSPDGDRLVSVNNELVRIWQLNPEQSGFGPSQDVSAVAVSAEQQMTMLGNRQGQLRILRDPQAMNIGFGAVEAVSGHKGAITSLAIGPSGRIAASGGSDGVIRIWDLATATRLPIVLSDASGPVKALAISPNDRWVISADADSVQVFDLQTGLVVRQIEMEGVPGVVAFSGDSKTAAAGDSEGNIVLVAPEAGFATLTIRGASPVTALRFADQAALLASGTEDGQLVFRDTQSSSLVGSALQFAAPIRRIALSPEARQVHVQSGSWLHAVSRDGGQSRIVTSRLLPEFQRGVMSWVSLTAADARVFGVPLSSESGSVPERDWSAILGLSFDPDTGVVGRVQG